jgi:pimeloyl-ACP methyl ester carboxylesterase
MSATEHLQIRIHGDASLPTLVYLPGMHGDWTLVSSFRAAVAGKTRFVEFTYPRTTTATLDDLSREIEEALLANGVHDGWLLGESFGSQPAWQIVKRFQEKEVAHDKTDPSKGGEPYRGRTTRFPSWKGTGVGPSIDTSESGTDFRPLGLVLIGGFVRHPVIWAVRMAQRVSARVPMRSVKLFCAVYARYAKFRHKHAPETLARVNEFVVNRTNEADRRAIVHRYAMIAENDLRPVARQTHLPVFYLAGLVDPLVPWPVVRWWLRKNCRGYRGGKTMWRADHNVFGTAPQKSAEQILAWISKAEDCAIEVKSAPFRRSASLPS